MHILQIFNMFKFCTYLNLYKHISVHTDMQPLVFMCIYMNIEGSSATKT